MSDMTAAVAARHLGVSPRQVERLARTGELTVTRTVGGVLLLDSTSVYLRTRTHHQQGRPWSAATSWAALALLSGEEVDWLSDRALLRLGERLRHTRARELEWLIRRRAAARRMQDWGDDTGLLRTGVSALRDPRIAARFNLSSVERGVNGYVRISDATALTSSLGLVDDPMGNMILQIVPGNAGYTVDRVLIAAVAVDLMRWSLDAREAAAGQRVLEELIDDFRSR